MTQEQAIEQYKEYLEGHIGNVAKALEVLYTLDIPYVAENIDKLREIVKQHDASKYEEPEWSAYLHHFYPTNDKESMMGEEFDLAVQHHIKNNKHHWNYWCDDKLVLNPDIDEEEYKLYTIERICDWLAMAAQHNEGPKDYYEVNKDYIIQPDYARDLCDEIFPKIPEDFSKDMWKVTRGELDESILSENKMSDIEVLINLIRDNATQEDVDKIIDKLSEDSGRLEVNTKDELINYIRKNFYKKPSNFKTVVCNILRKDRLEYFDEDELDEELYLNRDVVDGLGDRVKRSKTSNTIEIDTSMTNHDKQLKEMKVEYPKKPKDIIKYEYYNDNGEYVIDLKDGWVDPVGNSYIIEKTKKEAYKILKQCIRVINESVLTEMKLSEIKQKSRNQDPERIARSRKVKTTYLGMSKFGILNFKTTSQSRNGYHYQTIEFKDMKPFEDIVKSGREIKPMDVVDALRNQDVNIWCTDESFAFWAWAHQAYKNDFLYIDDRIPNLKKAIQAPKVNNVRLNGGACKHILSVVDYCTRPFVQLAISNDMNKFLAGNKEDKYTNQPEETKTQKDQVANWDWSEMEEYLGKSRIEIMSDIAKTLQIIPNTDKGDIITDIVGEALPNEEQGIKRQIVDKIEDLIDNEDKGGE